MSARYNRHVAVAETALGKKLPKGAQVHHVNGNGLDNRRENLVICHDAAYHALLHVRARVQAAGGDPNLHRICCGPCKALHVAAEMVGSHRRGFRCQSCQRLMRREGMRRHRALHRDAVNQRQRELRQLNVDRYREYDHKKYARQQSEEHL